MTPACVRRPLARPLAAAALLALTGCGDPPDPPRADHGVVVGDVSATRAVVWSRADRAARMRVSAFAEGEVQPTRGASVEVDAEGDFTGRAVLEGLVPGRRYTARVRFEADGASRDLQARFRTPPRASEPAAVRVAFGGDLAGQNVCRDADEGFPIVAAILAEEPDVFVGLGDMIYADDVCDPVGRYGNAQVPGAFGPAADLEEFRAHWRYSREDEGLRRLLASTAYVAVWDDHEVVDDFGPHDDTRDAPPYTPGAPLLPEGLRAFLEYNPLGEGRVSPEGAARLHRSLRWGRHLELIVLDTRQHRDASATPDTPDADKSMLGAAQRRWLEERLAGADATWTVVVSSVPIAIPTGAGGERGRDGWADGGEGRGYERELRGLLEAARAGGVRNLVWITTDVHFATGFRYAPFGPDDPFVFHEIATGPLNAGLFPGRALDPSLSPERLFFHGAESAEAVTTWEEAVPWFNFGILDVDATGSLAVRVLDGRGRAVFEQRWEPRPSAEPGQEAEHRRDRERASLDVDAPGGERRG